MKDIDYVNSFIPELKPKDKFTLISDFRINAELFKKGIKESFSSEPASIARYPIETSINSYFVGVSEQSQAPLQYDTLQIVISNHDVIDGEPILNGTSIYAAFAEVESNCQMINTSESPTSLFEFQLNDFDSTQSSFYAIYIRQEGEYTCNPVVLKPWEDPVSFSVGECYWAYPNNNQPGANEQIQRKLNAHKQSYGYGFLVEIVYPWIEDSWNKNFNPIWWHAYMNEVLCVDQLNLYLNNYKEVLESWQTPYGFNDIYVHHVNICYFNGWVNCSPPPCPPSPPGSNIHCWHYMYGTLCRFIYLDPPPPEK